MQLYCIEIESWENDGDNYQTKRYFSANEETVKWIDGFVNMFKSTHSYGECYGNDEVHIDLLSELTQEYCDMNGLPVELMEKTTKPHLRTFTNELLGYPVNYGYNWVRALSKTKITVISNAELNAFMELKSAISS